jgi:hypothetical protein
VTPRCGSGTTGLPQAFDSIWHLAEGGCYTQLLCENYAFDLPPFPAQAQRAGLPHRVEHEPSASFRVPLRTFGPGHDPALANDRLGAANLAQLIANRPVKNQP